MILSLGFGKWRFGAGLFGHAPVSVDGPRGAKAAVVNRYDGLSNDWLPDAYERIRSLHPVDQGVAFSILFVRGTIKSDASIGHDILSLPLDGGERDAGMVNEAVRNSFPMKQYLQDRRVTIKRIEHELIQTGGVKVAVYYVNEELRNREEQRVVYES